MPSEIESYLAEHEKIMEVVVMGIPDTILGERSCAFLRMAKGNVKPEELREHLSKKGVAQYKVPDQMILLDEFPHTATGKINKRMLLVLEMEGDLLMERSYGLMVGADVSKAGHVKRDELVQMALELLKDHNNGFIEEDAILGLTGELPELAACYKKQKTLSKRERMENLKNAIPENSMQLSSEDMNRFDELFEIYKRNYRCAIGYTPKPFAGDLQALFCLSDKKHKLEHQIEIDKTIEEFYDFFVDYQDLNSENKETLNLIMRRLLEVQANEEAE